MKKTKDNKEMLIAAIGFAACLAFLSMFGTLKTDENETSIEELNRKRKQAEQDEHYEEAANYRDKINAIIREKLNS